MSTKIVLDASVALAWFLPGHSEAQRSYANTVLDHIRRELLIIAVPALFAVEIGSVLLKARRSDSISAADLERAMKVNRELFIEFHHNLWEMEHVMALGIRYGLTGYDALYLDLAVNLELPLATIDEGMQAAATRHGVSLFKAEEGA